MRVALEHLHTLMSADRRNLLVRQTALDQAANGFVAEVVKLQSFYLCLTQCFEPRRFEHIRPAPFVLTRLSEKDQRRIIGSNRIVDRLFNDICRRFLSGTARAVAFFVRACPDSGSARMTMRRLRSI